MIDYNELFKQEAFKSINPDILEKFKILISNIKEKNTNEALLYIMDFYNSMPKNTNLSKEQSDALIKAIMLQLPKKERDNFLNMLELMNSIF